MSSPRQGGPASPTGHEGRSGVRHNEDEGERIAVSDMPLADWRATTVTGLGLGPG